MSGLEAFATGTWLPLAVAVTWKSIVLVLLAAGVSVGLRRCSAAVRHMVWAVALAGLLLLPVSGFGPSWSVRVRGWPGTPAHAIAGTGRAAGVEAERMAARAEPATEHVPTPELARAGAPRPEFRAPAGPLPVPAVRPPVVEDVSSGGATPAWPRLLFVVWLLGACLALLAIASSVLRVWLLGRRARPLSDARVRQRLAELARELDVGHQVRLLEVERAVMPVTWGVRRATILLPAQARDWHPALLDAVLLHELAHVQRHDLLAQLGAELASALYWYNPLVWWAAGRLREESELACDDVGARGLAGRPEYAHELVELTRALRSQRRLTVAAIGLARHAQLTSRVLALLDETRSHLAASRRQRWVTVTTGCVVVLPLWLLSPQARQATASAAASTVVQTMAPLPRAWRAPEPVAERPVSAPEPRPAAAAVETVVESTVPGISLTSLMPAVAERPTRAGEEADMRAHATNTAAVLVGLALAAPAVEAQNPLPTHYTIYGTVTDSLTGRPIADAALGFKPAYKAAMTDSLGRFVLKGVKAPKQTVVVEQLGYEQQTISFQAKDSTARLDVRLNPDPVVLKGLTVIVRDYHRMLKLMSVGRVYERRDLLNFNTSQLQTFLLQVGAIQPVGPVRLGQNVDSVWVRGRDQRLAVMFDDYPVTGGFAGMPGYPASELYAVIVSPGGGTVRVLTNWYIEYLARTGRRLSM